MRVRKKPDLRLNMPSYPSDYVEMPPETRKKIEEVIRNSMSPTTENIVNTPSTSEQDDIREETRTPEVRIVGPEDDTDKSDPTEPKDDASSAGSPVVYRKANKEGESKDGNSEQIEKHVVNFSAFAHKFKYRSPLWIESDSDVSKSSSDSRGNNGGLCNSDDSIGCHSSDSSDSINNFLDSKVTGFHS
uniref:SFRICE_021628 n=1 Tax=Spodoptera frugiperda TaxID=7108 RepID=A0A2H1WTR9_SPOFR